MTEIVSPKNTKALENRGRLLVGYLVAGYPDRDSFLQILRQSVDAGLDIVEVGFPSGNPYTDGEVIQNAHKAVDPAVATDIDYWREIRGAVDAPIWIMGYGEDLVDTGLYLKLAQAGVADAFVIPNIDAPLRRELARELAQYGVDMVGSVNPDTPRDETDACLSREALIYLQLYAGPTGLKVTEDRFPDLLLRAKQHSYTRVFAGFGIDEPERVAHLLDSGFDGVIVGTAMIKHLNRSRSALMQYIGRMKEATGKERSA